MRALQHSRRIDKSKLIRSSKCKGVKEKTLAPLLKTIAPAIHRLIFGKERWFRNEAELNRHTLQQRFLGEIVQQNQFESIFDINPANRFRLHSCPTYTTRRYARNPGEMISVSEKPDSVLVASAKSYLTENGQLVPVGNLSLSVWTDDFPHCLANLSHAHINERNKIRGSVQLPDGATDAEKKRLRLDLLSKLEGKLPNGSPITSTTAGNSLIDKYLKTWGDKDEYIEIDVAKTNSFSSSYVAAMILFAAKNDDINVPKKNNWRKEYRESNGDDMQKMAKLLIKHGIDPDGKWTDRERSVYYALVANEHMLIGTTPACTARIVKT